MITPRWRKVFADLWNNKTRTLLTILTIAVGVMAVGFIRGMAVIVLADMNADYQAARPHEAILYTAPFDESLVVAVQHVAGVLDAEGRSQISSRVIISPDKKVNITITGMINAFTTPATIEWLGGTPIYNELLIKVVDHPTDKGHVEAVAKAVSQHFTDTGIDIYDTLIYNPGRHFSADIFIGVTAILTILGVAIVFLSIFLVINTINVLLSQHVRQIGIMKAIGGRLEQLVGMYVVLIMSFGVLALLIAIPLGAFAAYTTSGFMANFLNFKLQGFRLVPSAILLQVITGLGVPLAAGLVIWLVVILSLSALASLMPASRTVRLTIRDVLAYE
jgi:ABC-type antimicrobial peptide transport system permease subunit